MNEQEIIDRWAALLKGNKAFIVGKVKAVSGNTCTVVPANGDVEITGVRLSFDSDPDTLITPAENSFVVVGRHRINKTTMQYFIVQCTKAESVKLHGDTWSITKAEVLKTELDKTNEVINIIVNTLSGWTVIPNDGGGALQSAFNLAIADKVVGNYGSIKNDKVKHG